MRSAVRSRLSPPKQKVIPKGMAFLFCMDMKGARSLRFDHKHFAGHRPAAALCAADRLPIWQTEMRSGTEPTKLAEYQLAFVQKIKRKSDRHGGGKAAGVSRLSVYLSFSIIGRIFAVVQPAKSIRIPRFACARRWKQIRICRMSFVLLYEKLYRIFRQ